MHEIHISLGAEKLGTFLGLPITNTLLMTLLGTATLFLIIFLSRNVSLLPNKFQVFMELLIGGIFNFVKETLESVSLAKKYFPLIATLFLSIVVANLIHFLPGVHSILFLTNEGKEVALLRGATSDLNVTLALALISFVSIELAGVYALGFSYAKKFVNLDSFLGFVIGIIDLFSEAARLISFSFRLFGNIFAGEVVIAIIVAFIPVIAPVPMMGFEFFVGIIQAAIFALLTLFFIKSAVTPHH